MYTFDFSFLVWRQCDHVLIQDKVCCIAIARLGSGYKVLWIKNFKILWLRWLILCDLVSLRDEIDRLAIHNLACNRIDGTFMHLIVDLWLFDRDSWYRFTVIVIFTQGRIWIGSAQLILLYFLFLP